MNEAETWQLQCDGILLGTLTLRELSQPWFFCAFAPTQLYEGYQQLFENEVKMLDTGIIKQWEKAYKPIEKLNLRLYSNKNNKYLPKCLLHIDGSEAWFRY